MLQPVLGCCGVGAAARGCSVAATAVEDVGVDAAACGCPAAAAAVVGVAVCAAARGSKRQPHDHHTTHTHTTERASGMDKTHSIEHIQKSGVRCGVGSRWRRGGAAGCAPSSTRPCRCGAIFAVPGGRARFHPGPMSMTSPVARRHSRLTMLQCSTVAMVHLTAGRLGMGGVRWPPAPRVP